MSPSTGSTGDSYENALAENLWSTIKIELVYWPETTFATRAEAEHALLRYIDGWYNPPPHPGRSQRTLTRGIRGNPQPHPSQITNTPDNRGKLT